MLVQRINRNVLAAIAEEQHQEPPASEGNKADLKAGGDKQSEKCQPVHPEDLAEALEFSHPKKPTDITHFSTHTHTHTGHP